MIAGAVLILIGFVLFFVFPPFGIFLMLLGGLFFLFRVVFLLTKAANKQ